MRSLLHGCIAAVDLSGRCRRFDCRKFLEDSIGMLSAGRNKPRVSGSELDRLAFDGKLGLAGDHIADGFIVAARCRLVPRSLLAPEPHRYSFTRHQIGLVHVAAGRGFVADLLYCRVRHGAPPDRISYVRCREPSSAAGSAFARLTSILWASSQG